MLKLNSFSPGPWTLALIDEHFVSVHGGRVLHEPEQLFRALPVREGGKVPGKEPIGGR